MSTIVNGQVYDHGDVEVTFSTRGGGLKVIPVESIKYSTPLEDQAKWGHQRYPVARTTGRVEPEGECSALKENADELLQWLQGQNGSIAGDTITITVRYGSGTKPKQVDKLFECKFTDIQNETGEGTDAPVTTLPFRPNRIELHGGVVMLP